MNDDNQKPFVDKQAQFDSLVEQITSDVEHLAKYNQFLDECIENMGTEKDNKRMRTQMNAQIGDANELIQNLLRLFQELEDIKFKSRKDNENKNKVFRRLNNSYEEYYEKFTNQIKEIANSEKKFIDTKQSIFNASSIQEPNKTVHYEHGETIQPEHYSQVGSHYQQGGSVQENNYDQNQQYNEQYNEQYQQDPNYQSYHNNNQSQAGYYDENGNYIGEQQGQEGQYNNYEHQQEGYYDNNNQQHYGEHQEGGYYENNQQQYGEHQEGGHYQNEHYGEHQGEQYNQQHQENQEGGYEEKPYQESVHENTEGNIEGNTEGNTGEHRGNSQYGSVAQQRESFRGSQVQKSVHGGSVVQRGGSNFGSIRGSVVQKPYENREELRQSIVEATNNLEFYSSIIKQRESQFGEMKRIASVIGGDEGLKKQSFADEESKEVERSEDVEVPVNEDSNFDNGLRGTVTKNPKKAKKHPKLNMLLIALIAVVCIGLVVTFVFIQ